MTDQEREHYEIIESGEKVRVAMFTDGGPWMMHNLMCWSCDRNLAVYQMNENIFMPCDACRRPGDITRKPLSLWQTLVRRLEP